MIFNSYSIAFIWLLGTLVTSPNFIANEEIGNLNIERQLILFTQFQFELFANNIHISVFTIEEDSSFESDRVENSIYISKYFSINQFFLFDVFTQNA